jgi:ATP-dependent Clp protease ATP-binding subunit ClpA
MAGWYLGEQARQALRTARRLARGRRAAGSADPLLAAILGQWDDEHAGGPALLRACGLTAEQAGQLAATLLAAHDGEAAAAGEPRVIGGLRFVLDQADLIAAEVRAPYVGTEHLVVTILWYDSSIGAHELRRLGVSYAQAAEQLATLPHRERAEQIDPLEAAEVPTPAAASLGELVRQQVEQHPIPGDGRISTLHHLLALFMHPGSAAGRLLGELGVSYEEVVRRIEAEGARRVAVEDWRREEHRLEGWEEFRVTDQQNEVIRGRFHGVTRSCRAGVSGSWLARTWTTRNGRWCGSTLGARVSIHVPCSTASSTARREHVGPVRWSGGRCGVGACLGRPSAPPGRSR